MNILDCLIVYPENYDEYEVNLTSKKFSELSDQEKENFLYYLLDNTQNLKCVLQKRGFYRLDDVKEQKGILVSDKDRLYYFTKYNLSSISQKEKLSDDVLERIGDGNFLIEIETPETIKAQIESFKERREDKKKKLEEKKKQKQILKAKKLLENLENK